MLTNQLIEMQSSLNVGMAGWQLEKNGEQIDVFVGREINNNKTKRSRHSMWGYAVENISEKIDVIIAREISNKKIIMKRR